MSDFVLERDDDDGEEFHRYSLSMDDDVPMSPNTGALFLIFQQAIHQNIYADSF